MTRSLLTAATTLAMVLGSLDPSSVAAQAAAELAPPDDPYLDADLERDEGEIADLENRISMTLAQASTIDVYAPLGVFFGGLALTAVGGVVGPYGMVDGQVEPLVGGFSAAVIGMTTWIVGFVVWRAQAHRLRRLERRAAELSAQLRELTVPALRF